MNFVAQYTEKFVQEMLDLSDQLPHIVEPIHFAVCEDFECLAGETVDAPEPDALAPAEAESPLPASETAKIQAAVKKLHSNLGHPSNRDLVRILQNGKSIS